MNWLAWVLIGGLVLNTLATIGLVGQPRKPITPGAAVVSVIFNGLFVWAVVALDAAR